MGRDGNKAVVLPELTYKEAAWLHGSVPILRRTSLVVARKGVREEGKGQGKACVMLGQLYYIFLQQSFPSFLLICCLL